MWIAIVAMLLLTTPTSASLILNEISPNPSGKDEGREWIELYNNGTMEINLTGWLLRENDVDHKLSLIEGEETVAPAGFVILVTNATKFHEDFMKNATIWKSVFSLSNEGETLALLDNNGTLVDSLKYSTTIEGQSLCRSNSTVELCEPTPGEANQLAVKTTVENSSPRKNQLRIITKPLRMKFGDTGFVTAEFIPARSYSHIRFFVYGYPRRIIDSGANEYDGTSVVEAFDVNNTLRVVVPFTLKSNCDRAYVADEYRLRLRAGHWDEEWKELETTDFYIHTEEAVCPKEEKDQPSAFRVFLHSPERVSVEENFTATLVVINDGKELDIRASVRTENETIVSRTAEAAAGATFIDLPLSFKTAGNRTITGRIVYKGGRIDLDKLLTVEPKKAEQKPVRNYTNTSTPVYVTKKPQRENSLMGFLRTLLGLKGRS